MAKTVKLRASQMASETQDAHARMWIVTHYSSYGGGDTLKVKEVSN